ncbi:protein translocase subunit SecF [Caloramator mitchellensis]|nr:protein translocase subunit SecF [Caloramator mitchellensis]
MYKIIEKRKLWFSISLIIILIGLGALAFKGLNLGIDFKGGTVITIKIGQEFNVEELRKSLEKYDTQIDVREIEGQEVTIRSNKITTEQVNQIFADVKAKYNLKDDALRSIDTIGPTIGQELRKSAIIATLLATIGILAYVTIRFELWSGLAAIVALIHDLLITLTVYAVLQIPVNSSFIAAMLTILGYSINDTIVVFDRIRENKKAGKYHDFETLADASITQTLARSINTVMTTLFTITAIYLLGVPAIKEFALPLIIGIVSGAYSSIFIATPLWVLFEKKAGQKVA